MSAPAAANSSGAVVVAPLPPSCLLINGAPPEMPLLATTHQLDQIRHHLSSASGEHAPTARDQLVALLLECTPLAADVIDIVASYRLHCRSPLWVSAKVGAHHHDSRPFDCFDDSDVLDRVLRQGWCVRQIIGWGGKYCNGVRFVYGLPDSQNPVVLPCDLTKVPGFITSPDKHGKYDSPREFSMYLLEDEFIQSVLFNCGGWCDSLTLTTNLGRSMRIGRSDGGHPYEIRAPEGAALIGLFGTIGGHLHGLGAVFASIERHKPLTADELAGREGEPSPPQQEDDRSVADMRLDSCCSDN